MISLSLQLKAIGLKPECEYRFDSNRRWRFDFAFPDQRMAIEVEGGVHTGGRHVRGNGYTADCQKYNEATLCGWRVLRFTTAMVASGEALTAIERGLSQWS